MTKTQEIPADVMAEARELYMELAGIADFTNHFVMRDVKIMARALLARDTAARKDQALKDAEIARTCMLTVPLTPGSADGASIAGKQIATAIEATITGGRNG